MASILVDHLVSDSPLFEKKHSDRSMSSDLKNVAIICILLLSISRKKKTRKRYWVKYWLLKRQTLSHILVKQLRISATNDVQNYLRMDDNCFKKLLKLVFNSHNMHERAKENPHAILVEVSYAME
jgi:hypothetical protein